MERKSVKHIVESVSTIFSHLTKSCFVCPVIVQCLYH